MKHKFFLSLLLLLAASTTANAYDVKVNGIYYNLNGNEATVTYEGYNNIQTGYYSGDVIIPETITCGGVTYAVTAIGSRAFSSCTDPISVFIPKSVTSIATFSFSDSSGMMSITVDSDNPVYDSRDNCNAIIKTANNKIIAGCQNTIIPNSVTVIGNGAFYGCNSLTSVTIPNSITTIEVQAYAYCLGLISVHIGKSVTFIDEDAFGHCTSLSSITVDGNNSKYDSRDNCNAIIKKSGKSLILGCKNTIIPNSVTTIGSRAFEDCIGLTSITIPNSVTTLRDRAFLNCSGLSSVAISNSVNSIGDYAFSGCSVLSSVIIPSSVITIGNNPFSCCSSLTSITVENDNPVFDSRDNCNAIIRTASNSLVSGCQNTIIPNSITSVGESAFHDCIGLSSVTIPNSVTSIGNYAFEDCKGLNDVYSYITDLTNVSIGSSAFVLMRYPRTYSNRTLHVPYGTAADYRADSRWYPYFGTIVEMEPIVDILGDINGDGEINLADINALIDMVLMGNATTEDYQTADINGDGYIDICDVIALIDLICSSDQ